MKLYSACVLGLAMLSAAPVYLLYSSSALTCEKTDLTCRISMRVARADGQFALVIGDSNTKFAKWPASVCGVPLIKAGIGGAKAASYPLSRVLSGRKPRVVAIALGTNDAILGKPASFANDYESLMGRVALSADAVLLAEPPPGERDDVINGRISAVVAAVRSKATKHGLNLVSPRLPATGATRDGVHLTKKSQKLFVYAVTAGIERALGCSVLPTGDAKGSIQPGG